MLVLPILYLLFRKIRGVSVSLTALAIFLFLPLPQDKLLEIRPDLLATVLSLIGLYLFILFKNRENKSLLFASGLFFSLSLSFVPKTIFFLLPVLAVAAFDFYRALIKNNLKIYFKSYLFFILGFSVNILFVLFLIFTWGKTGLSLYSMTIMAGNVTKTLGAKFYMRPDIFFYPNDAYYAVSGFSQPLVINLIIYIAAAVFGIYRFVSSWAHSDNRKSLAEFLISVSFLINLIAFVKIYPLKHLQYLIPVAPFIAFYFADLLWTVLAKITARKQMAENYVYISVIVILIYFGLTGYEMYKIKRNWQNRETLNNIKRILQDIPASEPIFDLTGETIFYPNGYYFCCLPYGQYQEAISFNLPNIEKDFESKKTRYIHTGSPDRLGVIPNLQAKFIKDNFRAFYPDGSMLVRK